MRRPDFWIVLLLFLIPLFFFAPVTFGGRTLIPADNLYQFEPWAAYREQAGASEIPHNALLSDLVLQNYQWKQFIRQNIDEGELPLWQPNQFTGTPFLANGQHSLLYPFSLIYYLLPLESAYGWFTVSQLWLAGVLMFLYIRGIGLGRIAGLIAALTVQLSSFFIVSTVHPMIQAGAAWLPLILLMTEYIIRRQPLKENGNPATLLWVIIGAAGLGMTHLAGHLEIVYYTLLVTAFYGGCRILWEVWHHKQTSGESALFLMLTRPVITLVSMVALGFGLGAVQFIPGVEAANNSFRTGRDTTLEEVRGYALPTRHIAKFVLPNVFGNPAHHDYFDVFEWETIPHDWQRPNPDAPDRTIRVTNTDFGIKNYVEGGVYVGILPLILAAYGLAAGWVAWRKKEQSGAPPLRIIFVSLALLSLAFMFGTPFYALLYYGLPGVDQLHTPFRWIWVWTVCIAVLAAYGTEALSRSGGEHEHGEKYNESKAARRFLYLLAKRGGWVLVYGGTLVLLGLIISRLFFPKFEPLVTSFFEGLAGAQNAFPDVNAFYSYQFRNILLLALMVIGAGAVLRVSRCPIYLGKGNRRLPIWQAMAVVVIALDLFAATFDFNPAARKAWLSFKPPAIEWLQARQQEEGLFRLQAYNWGEEPLNANSGWQYGLHDLRGYDSLFSYDYAQMMGKIASQGGLAHNRIDSIFYDNPQALANPLLDLLNVRYIITDWLIHDATQFGYEEVYVDAGTRIYRNKEALPRAYTVPLPANGEAYTAGERCPPSIFGRRSGLSMPSLQDLRYIPPLRGACIPVAPATITVYENITVYVDAQVEEDSWLVLADGYDAGWRAYIKPRGAPEEGEKEIEIVQVNDNLRGVRLPAGDWTVRFRYSPASFQVGAFLTFTGAMLLIFLFLVWLWQTFVSAKTREESGNPFVKNSLVPIVLNLFNRGIDFAFAFIMLRILGPENAGIYYYAIVIFGWFDIVTNFGLNTLLTREVARHRESAGIYLFNTSLLRLGLGILALPVLGVVLFTRNATVSPSLDSTAVIAILLLYLGLIPNSISTGLTALFYAFEKAEYPAAISTITTLLKVSLGLGTLLLGWGVVGLAGVSILTNIFTLGVLGRLAYPLLRGNWRPVRDGALQRTMLREAFPLMINHLLATVFFKSDVVLMEAINGAAEVGVYSTSYKWLDALNVIPAFFTMALLPILSRQAHSDLLAFKKNYLFGIKLLFVMAVFVAVLTTFLAYGLVGFLGGRAFLPAGAIALQIMIWSIPVGWLNSLTQYVLIALDRQRYITGAFIVSVSFNVITNLIFLPAYGYRAAAITTILSEMLLFAGFFVLLRPVLGSINWLRLLWRPVVIGALSFLVLYVSWEQMPLVGLAGGLFVFGVGILLLNPFDAEESARLARLMPGRLRKILLRQPA